MSMDFPVFFSLIIEINYPHLAGGLKGPPILPQELEVGGHRPPYLLVCNIHVYKYYLGTQFNDNYTEETMEKKTKDAMS